MDISLGWHEFSIAAHVGQMRTVESIRMGLKNGGVFGSVDEAEAAAAEMAVAKATGVYWDGSVNNFDRPDVGDWHVRFTTRSNGCLIIRPKDVEKWGPDARYVLVTGGRGNYSVRGYILAYKGAVEDYWKAPGGRSGAFFVPQSALTRLP